MSSFFYEVSLFLFVSTVLLFSFVYFFVCLFVSYLHVYLLQAKSIFVSSIATIIPTDRMIDIFFRSMLVLDMTENTINRFTKSENVGGRKMNDL